MTLPILGLLGARWVYWGAYSYKLGNDRATIYALVFRFDTNSIDKVIYVSLGSVLLSIFVQVRSLGKIICLCDVAYFGYLGVRKVYYGVYSDKIMTALQSLRWFYKFDTNGIDKVIYVSLDNVLLSIFVQVRSMVMSR